MPGKRTATVLASLSLMLAGTACGGATSRSSSHPASSRPAGGPGTTTAPGAGGSGGPGQAGSRDFFQGSVTSATGAYADEGGRTQVALEVHGAGPTRTVRLTFHSLPCQGAPQCLQLDGSLTGRIVTERPGTPDTGRSFLVKAGGHLTTLGPVTANGIGHGTGFIARGHEILELTLASRSGRVMVRGLSGAVGAFSSP